MTKCKCVVCLATLAACTHGVPGAACTQPTPCRSRPDMAQRKEPAPPDLMDTTPAPPCPATAPQPPASTTHRPAQAPQRPGPSTHRPASTHQRHGLPSQRPATLPRRPAMRPHHPPISSDTSEDEAGQPHDPATAPLHIAPELQLPAAPIQRPATPPEASTSTDTSEDEAGWTTQSSRKKRRAAAIESDSDSSTMTVAEQTKVHPKIPPIIIASHKGWQSLLQELGVPYEAKFVGSNLHVKVTTIDNFRSLQRMLRQKGVAFHTYTPPAERELKVVLRGLPYDTPAEEIKRALHQTGTVVTNVTPLTRLDRTDRSVKLPANTFLLRIKREGDWEVIWSTKKLLGVTVELAKYNPPKGLPQCYNCQRFGHSSANCNLQSRCVKCGGNNHLARDCKDRESMTAPKCCNCGGPHPASWRGCPAHLNALAVQRKRNTQTTPPIARRNPPQQTAPASGTARPYAAVVANTTTYRQANNQIRNSPPSSTSNIAPSQPQQSANADNAPEDNPPTTSAPSRQNPTSSRAPKRKGFSQKPSLPKGPAQEYNKTTQLEEEETTPHPTKRRHQRYNNPPACHDNAPTPNPATAPAATQSSSTAPIYPPITKPLTTATIIQWLLTALLPVVTSPDTLTPEVLITTILESLQSLLNHGQAA